MSNALSIAAVTAVLKDLLENGLVKDAIAISVGDVIVTALPPDRISVGGDERAQLNLFLYQITQNRNADWVSQDFRSKQPRQIIESRSTNPPLALDLHYLLTAYGAKDFQAELLLGYAMQLLHRIPVLTRNTIEASLKSASTVNTSSILSQALGTVSISDLAGEIGQIKICPEFFSMEDTSKLWSSLQTPYRPSAAYQASMVCINSYDAKSSGTCLQSFHEPIIEQITALETDNKILAGGTLIIRGKQLRSDITRIRIDGMEKLIEPQTVQDMQISLPVPASLYAGIHTVQIVHLMMGTPGQTRREIASNVAAFVLHPTIAAAVDKIQNIEITVKFNPKVGQAQRVVLLLNQVSKDADFAYTLPLDSRTEDTDSITIPVKNIKAGNYLVRVQVDGAESPLHRNQNGEYDSPQVEIS
jgi:Pvc16 N-terminal domain